MLVDYDFCLGTAIVGEVMVREGGAKLAAYAEGKVLGKVKGATEIAPF